MKKNIVALVILIVSMMCFAGCSFFNSDMSDNAENGDENIEINTSSDGITENNDNAGTKNASETLIYDKYKDISALPILDIDLENPYVNGERTLILEDSIDNELEMIIYNHFYYEVSDDYESGMALIGNNESLRIATENSFSKENGGTGIYEYTIHKLRVIEKSELENLDSWYREELKEDIVEYGFTEYAIVELNISWKYTEEALVLGPQLGDGTYYRYYLVAAVESEPDFRIYEIYWDDFLNNSVSVQN